MNRAFHWFAAFSFRETHASFQRGVLAVRGLFARHIALMVDTRRLALRAVRSRRLALRGDLR